MILSIHIFIAVSSMIYATYLWTAPTTAKFRPAYWLVAMTLLSGGYLIWSSRASLMRACLSGIIYIGVVSLIIVVAQRKLASVELRQR